MELTKNAQTVLEKRYLIRNDKGEPTETVDDLFWRVAKSIAAADTLYDMHADVQKTEQEFYSMMTNLEFLPNSPTLMNAGRPLGQLSACFVLPVGDSMEEIFEAIKQSALIHKSGGGTGFSFSRLRPAGSTVNSTGGVASGPISFMRVFNMATEAVKQGGTRRGANMGILRVDHPDILEFIDCKANNTDITNFNISIGITEDFMTAVESDVEYDLIDPSTGLIARTLRAKDVFDKIVDAAWRNGEPGIIFLDRLNRDNAVPSMGPIESTNPCGEQPLLPYEACNLGSINLSKMVQQDGADYLIDEDKLRKTVHKAVHFLDNVIDVNRYPLPKIDEVTKQTRKIGLGVMGWADLLLLLGIPYNSEQAVALAETLMELINSEAHRASELLAVKRKPFPFFEESIYKDGAPIRNATVTTIAPTGTLSIIAGCSSGIEPVFGYVYIRNVMDNTKLYEVNPMLKDTLAQRELYSEELMEKLAAEGSTQHIDELPEDIKKVFVSAHDISPEYHIKMQAAFQKHIDNAVSKTVNFSHSATREDVRTVYQLAFSLGCKGVTIYRDGSRDEQVLNIGKVNEKDNPAAAKPGSIMPRPRPEVTVGATEKVKIGCGNLYITVNYDDKGICEVFTNTGRAGGCPSQSEATARLVSIGLRSGMSTAAIVEQLKGIRCPSTIRHGGIKCTSCPDAIARAIEKVAKAQSLDGYETIAKAVPAVQASLDADEQEEEVEKEQETGKNMKYCPECAATLEHEGGCITCRNCGYSKCG